MKDSETRTANNMKYFNLKLNFTVFKSDYQNCSKEIQRKRNCKNNRISVDWILRLVTPSPALCKQELCYNECRFVLKTTDLDLCFCHNKQPHVNSPFSEAISMFQKKLED